MGLGMVDQNWDCQPHVLTIDPSEFCFKTPSSTGNMTRSGIPRNLGNLGLGMGDSGVENREKMKEMGFGMMEKWGFDWWVKIRSARPLSSGSNSPHQQEI